MSSAQGLFFGYSHGGRRAALDLVTGGSRVLLLGSGAKDLAALTAVSAKESGSSPVVLDLDGSLARGFSGHFDTFDYRSFLYDAFRLTVPEAWHAQLAASAYATALDLSSEEEAIINAAMQVVASDGTLLSPVSLRDVMGKVEGFRGFYVDKLRGKVGSLSLTDAAEDEEFGRLASGNVVLDFHAAPYPQAAELAAGLILAKVLAKARADGGGPRFLLLTDAHRLFRVPPYPPHSGRLLAHLLGWGAPLVMSTDQEPSLAPLIPKSFPVKVYSSDAWNSLPRSHPVLPGTFVIHDSRSSLDQAFVPRRIATKTADYARAHLPRHPAPALALLILEEVERSPLSTPESLAQYIAPEFLPADIRAALSGLEERGALILEPKDPGSGPRVFAYTLTELGRGILGELRG